MESALRSDPTLTTFHFQNQPQVRLALESTLINFTDFIFNVSTDPALMEAAAPDPTVGLVITLNPMEKVEPNI